MNAMGYAIVVFVISQVALVKMGYRFKGDDSATDIGRVIYSLLLALGTLLIMWGK